MADPFALLNLRGHVSTLDHVRALYQQTDVGARLLAQREAASGP